MLKSLLSLLLSKFYSKKENEAVGHQAMPSGNKIDIAAHPAEIEVWTNFATYTTPTDGYVSIRAESYKSTAAIQISTGSEDKMPSIFTAANNAGEWLQTVIPVSKGVSVRLQGGGIKNVVSYFSKTRGGYQTLKKLLLQGGVLCRLKHLYSSLRRSSCRVRKNGLLNNGTCRLRMWLIFLFQTTMTIILMFLQRTVCWCLGNLVRRELVTWKSTPLVRDLISISQALEFTKVLQCRLIEAKRFLSRQPQITEDIIRSFTSSRLSVKREVGLGGASC